ncbi:MAG: hypothetical protein Q9171_006060 [Xanthocarpia ochracea]
MSVKEMISKVNKKGRKGLPKFVSIVEPSMQSVEPGVQSPECNSTQDPGSKVQCPEVQYPEVQCPVSSIQCPGPVSSIQKARVDIPERKEKQTQRKKQNQMPKEIPISQKQIPRPQIKTSKNPKWHRYPGRKRKTNAMQKAEQDAKGDPYIPKTNPKAPDQHAEKTNCKKPKLQNRQDRNTEKQSAQPPRPAYSKRQIARSNSHSQRKKQRKNRNRPNSPKCLA